MSDLAGDVVRSRAQRKHRGVCRVCGCTEARGCPEGCWWVGPNLCSVCADKINEAKRKEKP